MSYKKVTYCTTDVCVAPENCPVGFPTEPRRVRNTRARCDVHQHIPKYNGLVEYGNVWTNSSLRKWTGYNADLLDECISSFSNVPSTVKGDWQGGWCPNMLNVVVGVWIIYIVHTTLDILASHSAIRRHLAFIHPDWPFNSWTLLTRPVKV
jgi:hypothetical protein